MPTSRLVRAFEAFASLVLAVLLLLTIPSMALADEQSFALGSVVNAGLDTGYSESNEIKESDPHFGWQLGSFNVKGFTSVQRGGESATFLKTVGDKVSLEFELSQDINRLNGNPLLTIANDENGYDQGMQIEKSSPGFGRGTLIVRKTDYQNNYSEPQVYNDYLAGVAAGANTQVDLFEEGDYEVVLDYEIKNDVHKVGGFLFVPEASIFPDYSNYTIRFKFSVRNGNTMPFLFDAQSGSELTNESVAPDGFVIDLARSRYLNVNVKREVLTGKSFDVRSNAPAKDGDRYTDEGIYTISTENTSTGQTTEKTIYVGSDPSLKAYAAAGYSTTQIEEAVNQGAAINDDGSITRRNQTDSSEQALSSDSSSASTAKSAGFNMPLLLLSAVLIVLAVIILVKRRFARTVTPFESQSTISIEGDSARFDADNDKDDK